MRKDELVTGSIYHVFNRSIANFKIFKDDLCYWRIINVIRYYQREKPATKFSDFIKTIDSHENNSYIDIPFFRSQNLVDIVAYCIMPTHIHLVLKQLQDKGISIFVNNIFNSYTRYFNVRHKRRGPLWESRFKNVLVKTDEQLIHLTRYIHLNPVTAYLSNRPEEWVFSSCNEYLRKIEKKNKICNYNYILDIEPSAYKKFMKNRISYQRELAKIKNLLLE
ncbi:MAG: transposase [Candidatus Omnitrophica bacterium]|nr:transposase [Candidatus Omnitrophota bacterium]